MGVVSFFARTTSGLLVLGAALPPPAAGLSPERAISQYVTARWNTAAGLPSHNIYAIRQGRDGYLWLGTGAGLVRFDGTRFRLVGAPSVPGYGDGGVTALAEGPDGTLYYGTTSGGAARYAGGVFTPLVFPSAVEPALVTVLLATSDGALWIGARSRHVYRHADGQMHALRGRLPDLRGPLSFLEDGDTVWIGSPSLGVFAYRPDGVERHAVTTDPVQAMAKDAEGALWIGTPRGLARLKDGDVRWWGQATRDGEMNVSALLADARGTLWIGTRQGLCRIRQGHLDRLSSQHGLIDDDVRALAQDHQGNLWVGTARGLTRLSDGRFVTHGAREGLIDPGLHAVAPGRDGSVWAGSKSALMRLTRDGAVRHYDLPSGPGPHAVVALHEDGRGRVWMSDNGRLLVLENGAVREQPLRGARASTKVSAITGDAEGPMLFLTSLGLVRLEGERLRPLVSGVPGYVHAVHRDRAGALWLASSLGLVRVRGASRRVFTTVDGLPANRVRSLSEDEDGSLWAATGGGLARVQGESIRALTVREGLPEGYLVLVLDDGRGRLWLASRDHVFRLEKAEVREVLDGKRANVVPLLFDDADGLDATEARLGSNPGFRGPDGRLFFATAGGLSVVDPAQVASGEPGPAVHIEGVRVDGRAERRAEYPPGRGDVAVDFAAIEYGAPHKIRFRYRLEGRDADWVSAGTQRSVSYSNLPPGRYRFTVMASNRDGSWTGAPAELAFTLRPPFHRTRWFYSASVLLGLVVLVLAYRLRVGLLHARFAAVLDERTRIARELHDTLAQGLAGLGMQLDTALKILPARADLALVRHELEQGRSLVRLSLGEVRRSIWVLRAQVTRDGTDLTTSLGKSLSQLVSGSGADFRFTASGAARRLGGDLERNLLRIAHEAVWNAARHARAKAIEAALEFDTTSLVLTVRDDGCGFDGDEARRSGAHFGLIGLAERARSLGGALQVSSQPGAGTVVECRLPYRGPGVADDETSGAEAS